MSEIDIKIAAGSSVRLLTAGKQCDNINVTVINGTSSDDSIMESGWIASISKKGEITKIPDSLTKIGSHAFNNCSQLALTSLPEGITSIGNSAFHGCSQLALTSLPENLISIDTYGFGYCYKLAITYLPESLTNIGSFAFDSCTNLTDITFKGTPKIIKSTAFKDCTNLLTINVPWAEGEVANAPWGATNATINYNYTTSSISEEEVI